MYSNETLKKNLINVTLEHKKKCDGESCDCSTIMLYEIGKLAGLDFTEKEFSIFV